MYKTFNWLSKDRIENGKRPTSYTHVISGGKIFERCMYKREYIYIILTVEREKGLEKRRPLTILYTMPYLFIYLPLFHLPGFPCPFNRERDAAEKRK